MARVFLLREIEVECLTLMGTVKVYTDLPGDALALRQTIPLYTAGIRKTVRCMMPSTTQGRVLKVDVFGTQAFQVDVILYRLRAYVKALGQGATAWQWIDLPVVPSDGSWQTQPLPIIPTPQEWSIFGLPIKPTPQDWSEMALPIDPTPQQWQERALPIPPAGAGWQWLKFPVGEDGS